MELNTLKLQQYVRASFSSQPHPTAEEKRFVSLVVQPALKINIDAVPDCMADIIGRLTTVLRGGALDEQEVANVKAATGFISGSFDGHPLVQGLSLQALRMMEKAQRGIHHMKGRRTLENDTETALIADSGLQLAMLGGNPQLMQEFGLPASACRTSLCDLESMSLPQPALAVLFPNVLESNWNLIDQRYQRPKGSCQRSLAADYGCHFG